MGDVLSGADDPFGAVIGLLLALVLLPFALAFVFVLLVFSLELALLLVLLPFVMAGQLLGMLSWVLVLRTTEDERRAVEVRGIRPMLEARRYYRSLRVS